MAAISVLLLLLKSQCSIYSTKSQCSIYSTKSQCSIYSTKSQCSIYSTKSQCSIYSTKSQCSIYSTKSQCSIYSTKSQCSIYSTKSQCSIYSTKSQCSIYSTKSQCSIYSTKSQCSIYSTKSQCSIYSTKSQCSCMKPVDCSSPLQTRKEFSITKPYTATILISGAHEPRAARSVQLLQWHLTMSGSDTFLIWTFPQVGNLPLWSLCILLKHESNVLRVDVHRARPAFPRTRCEFAHS